MLITLNYVYIMATTQLLLISFTKLSNQPYMLIKYLLSYNA